MEQALKKQEPDHSEKMNPESVNSEAEPKDSLLKMAGSAIHFHGFTEQKKQLFLRNAFRFWPNVTRLCASVCIDPSGYYQHLKLHPDFAQFMKAVDVAVTDDIEMVLRHEASNPKSFLDRMAYLRAHRPELYDRAKVVKIEGYKMGAQDKITRLGAVDTVIDAEITKTYLDRKERRQLKAGGAGKAAAVGVGTNGVGGKDKPQQAQ